MVQNVLLADTERRYFPTQFNVTGNVHQYVYMFHGYYRELAAGNGFVTSRRADITSQVKKKSSMVTSVVKITMLHTLL